MGKYSIGIPHDIALELRDCYSLDYLVESGTYLGHTALWAAKKFAKVVTIEIMENYYDTSSSMLARYPNVECILGDSAVHIPIVAQRISQEGKKALFFLDAHFGLDPHPYKARFPCPVISEINGINEAGGNHVIVVDDAGIFPTGNRKSDYFPNKELLTPLLFDNGKRIVVEVRDVIIAAPVEGSYKINWSRIVR